MRIKGTFLDEISHDIPHQNWGEAEWDRDFGYMREAGIDTDATYYVCGSPLMVADVTHLIRDAGGRVHTESF